MLTGEIKEIAKASTGLSDEQVEQMHPGFEKLFNSVAKTMQFQSVAEVVKSEHCFAQVRVGDRIVFDPFLTSEKSDPHILML